MLTMRVTPKMSDRPAPTKNRPDAAASPLSAWNAIASRVMGEEPLACPSPFVGEGRGGGSSLCSDAVPPLPDPSPVEPRYSEGSATQKSDRSRRQPTSVGGGENRRVGSPPNPHAKKSRLPAIDRPSLRRAQPLHFLVRGQHGGTIDI